MKFIFAISFAILVLAAAEYYYFKKLKPLVWKGLRKYSVKKKHFLLFLLIINSYPFLLLVYIFLARIYGLSVFSFPKNIFTNYLIIYPFWVFFILILQADLALILLDVIRIGWGLFNKNKAELSLLFKKNNAVFFVLFLVYVPARIIYDYYSVDVTHIEIRKADLPKALDNFKIALISDIHVDYYTNDRRVKKYVSLVNKEQPDLVLIAGDIISNGTAYIRTAAKLLSGLSANYGVYSCVGDHDNWAYVRNYKRSLREVKQALASVGIPMLDNQNIFIPVDSAKIQIAFATNNYVTRITRRELSKLTADSTSDVKIFLTHQPRQRLISFASKQGYDFYFAGHTHGGQITLLFPFLNLSPSFLETKYSRGAFRYGNLFVYVCRGLGMSIAPVRYNSTPEILIVTLKRNK